MDRIPGLGLLKSEDTKGFKCCFTGPGDIYYDKFGL